MKIHDPIVCIMPLTRCWLYLHFSSRHCNLTVFLIVHYYIRLGIVHKGRP